MNILPFLKKSLKLVHATVLNELVSNQVVIGQPNKI